MQSIHAIFHGSLISEGDGKLVSVLECLLPLIDFYQKLFAAPGRDMCSASPIPLAQHYLFYRSTAGLWDLTYKTLM